MTARLDRIEKKFIIPTSLRDHLVSKIKLHTGYDQEAGGMSIYPIITQYYDNDQRESYWEKQRNQHSRRKIRIRVYGSDQSATPPTTFLEVKHKHDGRGSKRRLRLPMKEALELVAGNQESLLRDEISLSRSERMIVREVLEMIEQRGMKFLCTLRYDRQAFVGDEQSPDLRITFDTGIACRFEELDLRADDQRFEKYLLPQDQCVMEVKTNSTVPVWLRDLIGENSLVPRGYSKFCTALEMHDPYIRELLGAEQR